MALEDIEDLLDGLKAGTPEAISALADVNAILESLGATTRATDSVMKNLASSLREDAAAASIAAATGTSLAQVKAALAAESRRAADAEKAAAAAAAQAAKPMQDFKASLTDSVTAATRIPGPIGAVQSALSKLGPYGQAAAVAIGVATIAVVAFTAALVGLAAAAISVVSKLSMMRAVLGAIHGAAAGNGIAGLVDKLTGPGGIPFAADKIGEWAKQLSFVARNGKQLESMVRGVAAAQALMGESGAAAATQIFETLGRGGAAAAALIAKLKSGTPEAREELNKLGLKTIDLANALGMTEAQFRRSRLTADQLNEALQRALAKKAGGVFAEMALQWPNIIQKAREGFLSLFDKLGPAVKPFMQAVQKLFAEFSKGGSVINTLKPGVTAVMTTLFSWATKAVNAIREIVVWLANSGKAGGVFSGVIVVLKAGWTGLVGIWKAVTTALAPIIAMLKAIFTNGMVLTGLRTIFSAIAVAVVVVVALLAAVVGAFAMVGGVVAGLVGMVAGAMSGIVGAITEGLAALNPAAFVERMAGMARAGLEAFKGVLGIASPARVLVEHGDEDIAGGAAIGVDKGTKGRIAPAARRMGDALRPGKGKGGGSGSGNYYDFTGAHFIGVSEEMVRRILAKVEEEMAGEAGAQPQGAG